METIDYEDARALAVAVINQAMKDSRDARRYIRAAAEAFAESRWWGFWVSVAGCGEETAERIRREVVQGRMHCRKQEATFRPDQKWLVS